jgi:hypothetical protein
VTARPEDSCSGNLLTTTDALGNVTTFDYDSGIGSGASGELTRM